MIWNWNIETSLANNLLLLLFIIIKLINETFLLYVI